MIPNLLHHKFKQVANLEKSYLLRLIICGMGVLFLAWISFLIQFAKPNTFSLELYYRAGLTLSTPILYFAGLPLLQALLNVHKKPFSIDVPIIVVLLMIYIYSLVSTLNYTENTYAYFDSILMILFIVLSCRFLEVFCLRRIKKLVQVLSKLPTRQVNIFKKDDQFHACDLEDIVIGDKLYIAPGEYFPVDGIICESDTSVDESMLTGEAHAIPKFIHDKVRAGTCNLDKSVIISASSVFRDSYFGKMLSAMQTNDTKVQARPPCDQVGLWQQMITLTLCAVIYCWWLPFDNQFALTCTMSTLLITCPCAIAAAYPLTTACLLEICAKKGILITNPLAFYKLINVQHVLFDKTGTLTEGHLNVDNIEYCNQSINDNVLPLIAAVEKNTTHPIASAIVKFANAQYANLPQIEIHQLKVFPGNGIRALVDGKFVLVGSARWLKNNGVFISKDVIDAEENHIHRDHIFVHCAIGGIEVARIQLKDKIRQEAKDVIQFLKRRNIDLSVLSGDRPVIVNAIAKQLGSISARAEALPQQKEAIVASLQDQGVITAMVGDGFNDAPALKHADIGIVVGANNPISLLCADIILQAPRLRLIQDCMRLSERARKILKQNYLLGFMFSLSMVPFAATGQLTPIMMLSSLCLSTMLVMANSARLKFGRKN